MSEYTVTDTAPYMEASGTQGTWNGFPVPVTTAAAFSEYLDALARGGDEVEPWAHGFTLREEGREDGMHLIYTDENGEDTWASVGTVANVPLYALDGWAWTARADVEG